MGYQVNKILTQLSWGSVTMGDTKHLPDPHELYPVRGVSLGSKLLFAVPTRPQKLRHVWQKT
jgi:hypothetical protein